MKKVIYDGANFCVGCSVCPVVVVDNGQVVISDPSKPEHGTFSMTVEEYNTLLAHAPKIQ